MGLIDDVKKRLSVIPAIKRAEEAINDGLQIVWETDPEKMQFEKLRSYSGLERCFKSEILRIDQFDISDYTFSADLLTSADPSYMELITILMNGGRLIPPMVQEGYAIVDGEEKAVSYSLIDGNHRVTLARFFGLDSVPVLVIKGETVQYWFTLDKWEFECGRIREETKHEHGFSWTEYNGVRVKSADGKVFTFKDHEACVDTSNTDYLVIQ